MACAKIAGVLLAAGRGTRFGGNKLEAILNGEMLGLYAARTLAGIGSRHLFAVRDPAHAALAAALSEQGFTLIDNANPAAGLGQSLVLATQAVMETEADAMLVCLGDMPFVTPAHLSAILAAASNRIVTSAMGDTRLPPALFRRDIWSTLLKLSGDKGAHALLQDGFIVAGAADMLADIDIRADLNGSS